MWINHLCLIVLGASFGLLAAAGVFTVLVAVGLVPRFAGRTHTGNKVILYEEMVIWGTVIGGLVSLFPENSCFGEMLLEAGAPAEVIRIWKPTCFMPKGLGLGKEMLTLGVQIG